MTGEEICDFCCVDKDIFKKDMSYYGENINSSYMRLFGIFPTALFGVIGSILALIVLTKVKNFGVYAMVLKALAVSDMLFNICILLKHGTDPIYEAFACLRIFYKTRGIINLICDPIFRGTTMASAWLIVLLAFVRYIVVVHPFKVQRICTRRKMLIAVLVIFALSIAYPLPLYFYVKVDFHEGFGFNERIFESVPKLYLDVTKYIALVLNFVVPFLLLLYFTIHTIVTICRAKSNKTTMSESARDTGITNISIVITIMFLVCGLCAIIGLVFSEVEGNYMWVVGEWMLVINSSANFVVYIVMEKTFRAEFVQICCCCWHKQGTFSPNADETELSTIATNKN